MTRPPEPEEIEKEAGVPQLLLFAVPFAVGFGLIYWGATADRIRPDVSGCQYVLFEYRCPAGNLDQSKPITIPLEK